tara:strand:+ start:14022 stop:14798 length:777 start_codon:yes stop_codon:yes gene_type:complete
MEKWIITTKTKPQEEEISKAKNIAKNLNCIYEERREKTLKKISTKSNNSPILIVNKKQGLKAYTPNQKIWFWHPGLSKIRIGSLKNNLPDHLYRSVKPKKGMKILDANLGMAHDALVLASCGANVIGLEKDKFIHLITSEGLKKANKNKEYPKFIRKAALNIKTKCIDNETYIKNSKDNFDAVCFSPMFVKPQFKSDDMMPLREVALKSWPTENTIKRSLKISRKVVIKVEYEKHPKLPEPTRWSHGQGSRIAYAIYE